MSASVALRAASLSLLLSARALAVDLSAALAPSVGQGVETYAEAVARMPENESSGLARAQWFPLPGKAPLESFASIGASFSGRGVRLDPARSGAFAGLGIVRRSGNWRAGAELRRNWRLHPALAIDAGLSSWEGRFTLAAGVELSRGAWILEPYAELVAIARARAQQASGGAHFRALRAIGMRERVRYGFLLEPALSAEGLRDARMGAARTDARFDLRMGAGARGGGETFLWNASLLGSFACGTRGSCAPGLRLGVVVGGGA